MAQLLHVDPYAEERPSIERLHAGIADAGLRESGVAITSCTLGIPVDHGAIVSNLREELDFRIEAKNLEAVRGAF